LDEEIREACEELVDRFVGQPPADRAGSLLWTADRDRIFAAIRRAARLRP
jgi:hypothetical protein